MIFMMVAMVVMVSCGYNAQNTSESISTIMTADEKESNEYNQIIASISSTLGEPKKVFMPAANALGYTYVPMFENDVEYIVITRDLQKKTIKKSDFCLSENYNGVLCVKGEFLPCITTKDVSISFLYQRSNGEYRCYSFVRPRGEQDGETIKQNREILTMLN